MLKTDPIRHINSLFKVSQNDIAISNSITNDKDLIT